MEDGPNFGFIRTCTKPSRAIFLLAACVCLVAQQKFAVISTVDEPEIAGRPVQLDTAGRLLPWPMPSNTGYSYSSHVLSQWTILWDLENRQKYHYFFCCFDFDRTTFELQPDWHWVNSTGYLRAMLQGFIERLYPYTGDERTVEFLGRFIDYELENGLTPAGSTTERYAWPRVPYPSANPGARRYTGWSSHGEDFVEPHVVGEDGYAYLRFYEMTGNAKYLHAAIRCADALAANFRPGDETHSPWPYRCYARDGRVSGKGMGPYSANVVEPIMLFDELVRIGRGAVDRYRDVRRGAWDWLQRYPMRNNVWSGYFEDVEPDPNNQNQVIPLEYARYVLLHPDKDPLWKQHARALIEWVKTTPKWPKYLVHGATVTTEQGNGVSYCCNLPNQCCDSHTARLAAAEAFYAARTGDAAMKEQAFRSYNWVTYFQGLPGGAHAPFSTQWWFTDQYADGPRRVMDAFWAFPEWAPAGESHLLGSDSVVTRIRYSKGTVAYSTFDPASVDVLRLDFVPDEVFAGGRPLAPRSSLDAEGYAFDAAAQVLRIRHDRANDVSVQGAGGESPFAFVTFDDPHRAAGSPLEGEYPTGVFVWPKGQWRMQAPYGRFGTFHVASAERSTVAFAAPRVFGGFDVSNEGTSAAAVEFSASEIRETLLNLMPGELRRIRTGWRDPVTQVRFRLTHPESLHFDNFVYTR